MALTSGLARGNSPSAWKLSCLVLSCMLCSQCVWAVPHAPRNGTTSDGESSRPSNQSRPQEDLLLTGDTILKAPFRAYDEPTYSVRKAFPTVCLTQSGGLPARTTFNVQEVELGARRVTMRCGLGLRQADVQWFIGGVSLEQRLGHKMIRPSSGKGAISFSEYQLLKNGNLRIYDLERSHEGLYHCTSRRIPEGRNVSACNTVELRLRAAPKRHLLTPRRYLLVLGTNFSLLICKASGYPRPTIEWSRDGVTIDQSNPRYRPLSDATLMIYQVSEADAGRFQCTATNEIGRKKMSMHVTVTADPDTACPVIIIPPRSRRARPGNSVTLGCLVQGGRMLEVNWEFADKNQMSQPLNQRHGQVVRHHLFDGLSTIKSELVIPSVTRDDIGYYTCTASNPSGSTAWTTKLTFHGASHL